MEQTQNVFTFLIPRYNYVFVCFAIGRVGVRQITTQSQEYPRITMPWLRQKRPVCHLIRLAQTV